jgi:hypothetical protein
LRYIRRKYTIYNEYSIENGYLYLYERKKFNFYGELREIISPVPQTRPDFPRLITLMRTSEFIGGTPTPLIKEFGNPYIKLKPLR